jgi:protein pelota
MRITKYDIVHGSGSLTLCCDSLDDMWVLYNVLSIADKLRCSTYRKVAVGSQGSASERVVMSLTVAVTALLFDTEIAEIRASGTVCEENDYVKMGSYHTLEVVLGKAFTVHKDAWDETSLAALKRSASMGEGGGSGAVELVALMLEEGKAQVCLVSPGLTVVRRQVEETIPKKRSGDARRADALQQFFEHVLAALIKSYDWERSGAASGGGGGESPAGAGGAAAGPPPLLIASPGSVRDAFRTFLSEAVSTRSAELKGLGRAQVVCAHAAAGSKWALAGVLADPRVAPQLGSMQASGETALFGAWQTLLVRDPERAQYGWRHCAAAAARGVVEQLLVVDKLCQAGSREVREDVAWLQDKVRASKGRVFQLSSMHASGELLTQMGGVVAVLRYVVHDLEEAALEQDSAPGLGGGRRGELDGRAGGEAKGGGLGGAALPGHRLQVQPSSAPSHTGKAAVRDKHGTHFDTDSDCSMDSDE